MINHSTYSVLMLPLKGLKNKRRLTFSFLFFLGVCFSSFSQGNKVSGKIIDADGVELPGVTVQVKGTSNGAMSGLDGSYELNNVPSTATLVFSFVGMQSQEVEVGGKSQINITLLADQQTLEEVVVVGYGTQKRKEISGTVSTLDGKNLNTGVISNPLAGAQGKIAGLVITQSSGDPNSEPVVRLRGTGSLSAGSGPLYVIDGVIGAPIQNVAPEDIASMDVLRDASSAAIYGSRGANGVIIITTKRGKSGETAVDFNTYYGTETISARPDLLTGEEFRAAAKKYNKSFDDLGANTDWMKELTRVAHTQNYNLGISGGGPKSSYRASVGYLDQVGAVIGSGKKRLSARLNLDSKAMKDKLNLKFNLSAMRTNADIAQDIALGLAQNMKPTDPVYNSDGTYFQLPGTFANFNPVALAENRRENEQKIDLLANVQADYNILENLVFHVGGTMRTQTNNINAFQGSDAGVPIRSFTGNSALRGLEAENDKQFEATLNYVADLGAAGNLTVLGGYTYQDVIKDGFGVQNNNFLTDLLGANNIGLGLGIRSNPEFIGSYKNEYKLASFLGRVQYTLRDKYFATVNFRRDGSTKFGENNKWGTFPSISVGWSISDEDFMKSITWIDNVKVRASWGRTGNSEGIDPLRSQSVYFQNDPYYDGDAKVFLPTYAVGRNPNPNLKWEVNENYGLGVDFSLAKGKLAGSLDYYVRQTKDLLYTVNAPQPPYPAPTILANVGSMENKGLETTLTYQWIDKTNFSWSSTLAASFNQNKVIGLSDDNFDAADYIFLSTNLGSYVRGTSAVNFSVLTAGQPVGVFYGAVVDHINDKGEYVFKDVNDDGDLDPSGKDRTYIGNPNPVFVGSLSNNFRYKNFDLSFMFTSNLGNKIMNTNNLLIGRQDGRIAESNALASALTSPINDKTTIPMDYYVESGNFLRLNNATFGYTLPVKSNFIHRARFYVAGNNLFVLSKYSGVDPEVSQELKVDGDNRRAPGIDVRETFFKTRAFTIGANLSF